MSLTLKIWEKVVKMILILDTSISGEHFGFIYVRVTMNAVFAIAKEP